MQVLYRFYDSAGELLYVGITNNPTSRFGNHMASKSWWPQVTDTRIAFYATRAEVEAAERYAIQTEGPRYNIRGAASLTASPRSHPRGWPVDSMPDCCHDYCKDLEIYFPYTWRDGVGRYLCKNGHRWKCWWGHHGDGEAMEHAGKPIDLEAWA